jgi:hypothetical protein
MMPEERWLPHDKAELINAIEREWDMLQDLIAKLDPARVQIADDEGWSPKDHIAHLAEWIRILMGFYMDLRRAHEVMGVAPEVTQAWDFEARNQLLLERSRRLSAEQVFDEFGRVYAELMARLNGMSFDDLMNPQHPFDPARRPLLLYVLRGTSEHFAEHRKAMEESLRVGPA